MTFHCLTLSRDPSLTTSWGFKMTGGFDIGNSNLTVQNVTPGSPADHAGLRTGDIITAIGERSTLSPFPMSHATASNIVKQAGNQLHLTVGRGDSHLQAPLSPPMRMSSPLSDQHQQQHSLYRPLPTTKGVIPHIRGQTGVTNAASCVPQNNVEEFLHEKAKEAQTILKQTYRTLPLIEPKPKVRRDLPTGCYMRFMEGPMWEESTPRRRAGNQNFGTSSSGHQLVNAQYNSPLNVYSADSVASVLMPNKSPTPGLQVNTQPQDISHSPTLQLIQQEERARQHSGQHSAQHSPARVHSGYSLPPNRQHHVHGGHENPVQTPSFRHLMNALLPGA